MQKMADLVEDMVEEILRRLPIKSLVRFKCVCKNWGTRFRNPNFIEAHHRTETAINNAKFMPSKFLLRRTKLYDSVFFTSLELTIYEDENVTITKEENIFFPFLSKPRSTFHPFDPFGMAAGVFGPCNGIVCVSRDDEIALWNPATREIKFLETSTLMPAAGSYLRISFVNGFGYDSKSDDYKVLRTIFDEQWEDVREPSVREGVHRLELYSLKKNEWKLLPDEYTDIQTPDYSNSCIDGVYHMLRHSGVLSFDLADEVFTTTGFPRWDFEDVFTIKTMTSTANYLGMVRLIYDDGLFEIWILKEIGVEDSWIKGRTVGPVECVTRFSGFWKDKMVVELSKGRIAVYDPENGRLQTLEFSTDPDDEMEYIFNYAFTHPAWFETLECSTYKWPALANSVQSLAPINGRYEHEEGVVRAFF